MRKLLFYIAALSLVGFSSCSEDLEVPRASGMAGAIRFGLVQDNTTKGIGTTSTNFLSQIKDFQVWAYYDGTATGEGVEPGDRYIGVSDTEGIFIDGDGKGTWSYHDDLGIQYWPATSAPLNFQAITPATDASFTISNTPADDLSHLTAVVNVPTDVKLQKDIMFAKADKQTYESNANCVSLMFNHSLSQVVFNGRLASNKITAQVSSIEIVNVHSKGNVGYFASDASLGSEVTGVAEATYSVGLVDEPTLSSMDSKFLTSEDGALLMLPQNVTAWTTSAGTPVSTSEADAAHNSYLKIKCTVTDKISGAVLISDDYVYIPFDISWEQGKKYTYTLVFGDMSGGYDENGESLKNMLPITFTVATSDDWVGVDGGEYGVGDVIVDFSSFIQATYNVVDGSSTEIYKGAVSGISQMYIDNAEVSPVRNFNFSPGIHSVCILLVKNRIDGQIHLDEGSFQDCSTLTEVILPSGLLVVDFGVFWGCVNLSKVTLPSSLTRINGGAFLGCESLTSIELPESLTNIGYNAFSNCSRLSNIISNPLVAPTLGSEVFLGLPTDGTLTVPVGATGYDTWLSELPSGWTIEYSDEL